METEQPRILAIDGNPESLATLKAVVERMFPEAQIVTAMSGPEGLHLALKEYPDVILLDVVMPGMDGFEVCRRLKRSERLQLIPVVFLTARSTDGRIRAKAFEAGAEAFLSKPVDETELTAQIRSMVKSKAAHAARLTEKDRLAEVVARRTAQLKHELAERVLAERRKSLLAEILGILNEQSGVADSITRILAAIQRETGFDAVGVRLQNGEDYPYFAQNGFSGDFLLAENSLIARDAGYDDCRDENGRVSLECTCGLVLSGKTDPANPGVTPGGSYWVNNALPALDIPADKDPRLHPRNRCIHEGFLSVALIPIRAKGEIVGLLQLNDRRKDRLTPDMIRFFEEVTASIGVALAQKWAMEALRESKEQFQAMFDTASIGIGQTDPQTGQWVNVNQKLCDITGYTRKEMLSLRVPEVTHPEDRGGDWEAFQKVIRGEAPNYQIEKRYIRKDGAVIWVRVNMAVIRDGDGRPTRTMATIEDITERKRAEEAVSVSEAKYRSLVDATDTGYLILDHEGHVVDANAEYVRLSGHRELGEIRGRKVIEWTAAHEKERNRAAVTQCARNGFIRNLVIEYVDGKGRLIPVEINATAVGTGESMTFLSLCRDITERKQAEEALRASEELLRESQHIAGLGSYVLDLSAQTWMGSDGLYRLLGIDGTYERSMEGWAALFHPDDRAMMTDYFRNEILGRGQRFDKEYRILRHDNRAERWMHALGRLECDDRGRPLRMYGTVQDITRRKQSEEEKTRLESQLQQAQKMESVGRLAGGVAHDFNNMLAVILGHAEISLDETEPGQPLYADLKEIHKAARRSADLTRQLLAFARKQAIAPEVLDLSETVSGTLKMLQRIIGERIRLEWHPSAVPCIVKVDPSQVDQMLANLCVNARDAIADVGRITIETGLRAFDGKNQGGQADCVPGEYAMLAVSDDGCGMDEKTLSQIFEPFFTTKGVGEGTGLGLATVYGAVRQNNGFIDVSSEPGRGTTFKIYLPRHGDAEGASQTHPASDKAPRGKETILLTEDEPAVLALTAKQLDALGYTVLEARTPDAALRISEQYPGEVDLLITDVIMPDMNGRDLSRQLSSGRPRIKHLFMSGYTADVIAHHGVLEEGVHFIQKPFSATDLAVKVRKVLDSD